MKCLNLVPPGRFFPAAQEVHFVPRVVARSRAETIRGSRQLRSAGGLQPSGDPHQDSHSVHRAPQWQHRRRGDEALRQQERVGYGPEDVSQPRLRAIVERRRLLVTEEPRLQFHEYTRGGPELVSIFVARRQPTTFVRCP